MTTLENVRNLDKKFAWSFFGTIIGIIGLSYAIYVDNFKDKKPEIVFEVLSNTNVLDLKEDISKLDILFDGENIKEKRENLRILTIKVINEGNFNILESHYDSKNPFGFSVENGKIVEKPELLETSIEYLSKSLNIFLDSLGRVQFDKVQLDKSQYFVLKILTICDQGEIPQIQPFGKISGITKNFPVRTNRQILKEEKSFWQKLIFGNFWIHFIRFWFYIIVFILFGFIVGLPLSSITDHFSKKKRKKKIKKFKENSKYELTPATEVIFDMYLSNGDRSILRIHRIISDPTKLLKIINKEKERIEANDLYDHDFEIEYRRQQIDDKKLIEKHSNYLIYTLQKKEIIKYENEKLEIDKDFERVLSEFSYFLKIQ
ncbi:MAG: hypothetical protein RBT49_13695 [Bacteroidales bacterium]|jgi:hypothetical protein|nr:hypothetical protein [Bacteroidales bacterium]